MWCLVSFKFSFPKNMPVQRDKHADIVYKYVNICVHIII